jgi:FG-GAP-like repeat
MFADINGDGMADACGRGQAGIWCELSTGTDFSPPFLQQDVFSDAQGWSLGNYYSSLRFADVDGDGQPDICGRGMAGIYCAHNNGNRTFGFPVLWDSTSRFDITFGDAFGWGLPQYGSTIMFADINGDGKADVCGRGRAGIWCELSRGTGFDPAFLAQHNFSDAEGWNQVVYYASLRFTDVNGDRKPDICGRRTLGNYCGLAK